MRIRMNKISSAVSFILKKKGVHIVLFFVMGILLFCFLVLTGWINYNNSLSRRNYDDYRVDMQNASLNQFEEWYGAVLAAYSFDEDTVIFVQSDASLPVFNPTMNSKYSLTAVLPSSKLSLSSQEKSYDYYLDSPSFSDVVTYVQKLFPQIHNTEIEAAIPFEHDEWYDKLWWKDGNDYLHTFHRLSVEDTPDSSLDNLPIYTSMDAIRCNEGTISSINLSTKDGLSSEDLNTINRITEYYFGQSFTAIEYSDDSSTILSKRIIYTILFLAIIATFQIMSYAFSMRQNELIVYDLCGESPLGLFMHYLIHFLVVLVVSISIGVTAFLIVSPVMAGTGFDFTLSIAEILRTIGVFFSLSFLTAVLYLLFTKRPHKGASR